MPSNNNILRNILESDITPVWRSRENLEVASFTTVDANQRSWEDAHSELRRLWERLESLEDRIISKGEMTYTKEKNDNSTMMTFDELFD